jgi:hypothetical protein
VKQKLWVSNSSNKSMMYTLLDWYYVKFFRKDSTDSACSCEVSISIPAVGQLVGFQLTFLYRDQSTGEAQSKLGKDRQSSALFQNDDLGL